MTRLRIAAVVALAAGLTLVGAGGQGQAHADEVTVTITPTVVIVTDATGRPIRTESIIPTPPAATPADQPGPKPVTVTVAPPNPGVLTLGQNDAGQWIGMGIGAVLGALGTVAVMTRRRRETPVGSDESAPEPEEDGSPEPDVSPDLAAEDLSPPPDPAT